ncbi:MAG: hypothetical protein IKX85_06710 [Clostridia bacterium]|nr:hypothetical protein [Clostridia bacterium]
MNDLSGLRFRTSLGGFRKKDVAQYIDALSRDSEAQKAELEDSLAEERQKMSALADELAEARAAIGSFEDEKKSLTEEIRSGEERLAKAQTDAEEAAGEKKALLDEIALLQERIKTLTGENEKLSARISDFENREASLEEAKRVVTDLEMAARLRAEESEASAKRRAAAILEEYQKEFDDTRMVVDHYKADTDVMIDSAEKHISSLQSLIEEFKRDLASSKEGLDGIRLGETED